MIEQNEITKMFDTNELNRLQRCAKNKDKKEILKWGQDFERRIAQFYMKEYKEYYLKLYEERLKDLDTAVLYTLHFNESCKFGNKRLTSIIDDLAESIRGFYTGEYNRKEYRENLKNDGIKVEEF